MSRRVLILDTSVFCCWLNIPGKEVAGPIDDRWTHGRITSLLAQEKVKGSTFVLPLATLIETGNHIAKCLGDRHALAVEFTTHLRNSAKATTPWAAFTDQSSLWNEENLIALSESWPNLAVGGTSIADATIKHVAEHYAIAGMHVEILTGDQGLKAYEPVAPVSQPRRRA